MHSNSRETIIPILYLQFHDSVRITGGKLQHIMQRSIRTIEKIAQTVNTAPDLSTALNKLVLAIHDALGVDVCSIYLDDKSRKRYTLMATFGLNPDSVGQVYLDYGEGLVSLVGERSEAINIENAPRHPRFKYIPGISEEPFQSFVGIPVIQLGDTCCTTSTANRSPSRMTGIPTKD